MILPNATTADESFREWFDKFVGGDFFDLIRGTIEDHDEEISPAMCLVTTDDPPIVSFGAIEMSTVGAKRHLVRVQAGLARMNDVSGVLLVTEAWARSQHKDEPAPQGTLEDDHGNGPGTTEVVVISAMRGSQQLICYCPISRLEGGRRAVTMGSPFDPAIDTVIGVFVLPVETDD